MKQASRWVSLIALVAALAPAGYGWGDTPWDQFEQSLFVPFDPGTMSFPVTPAQAVQDAQSWCGNPALALSVRVRLATDPLGRSFYVLASQDGQRFWVDCNTGVTLHWGDGAGQKLRYQRQEQNQTTPSVTISQAQLLQTATEFVQSHFPNYAALNLVVSEQRNVSVAFTSQFDNVWDDDNTCGVGIDEFTGTVLSYGGQCSGRPPSISLVPALVPARAEGIALRSIAPEEGIGAAVTYRPSELHVATDAFGQELLYWRVHVGTDSSPTYVPAYPGALDFGGSTFRIAVDANTGRVLDVTHYLGVGAARGERVDPHWRNRIRRIRKQKQPVPAIQEPLKVTVGGAKVSEVAHPPVLRRGTVYWYAKNLEGRPWALRMSAARGELRFTSRDGKPVRTVPISVAPDSGSGPAPPAILVGGKAYLAPEAVAAITGYPARWVPEKRTLEIGYTETRHTH